MRKLCMLATLTMACLPAGTARADGLIYQLPKDRSWVRYDMEFTAEREGNEMIAKGSLTVKSVGTAIEGANQCRWIEFVMKMERDGMERTIVAKTLIHEKHLKRGEAPVDHVVRAWQKQGDGEVQSLDDINSPRSGPLPAFLAGPVENLEKLDKEAVECKLGKLECEGITGKRTVEQGDDQINLTYKTRLHQKAAFGVVNCRLDYRVERGGQTRQMGHLSLKLADYGDDAESELPGSQ